jgi:hypothetical protein
MGEGENEGRGRMGVGGWMGEGEDGGGAVRNRIRAINRSPGCQS